MIFITLVTLFLIILITIVLLSTVLSILTCALTPDAIKSVDIPPRPDVRYKINAY